MFDNNKLVASSCIVFNNFTLIYLTSRVNPIQSFYILEANPFMFQTPTTPTTPATPSPKPTAPAWCLPKAGLPDAQLQSNLDYACGHGIDCGPIQPGGACFEPNTVQSHAAYAMNLYYQSLGKNPWNCDFSQTATLTSTNPSKLSLLISLPFNFQPSNGERIEREGPLLKEHNS